MSTRATRSHTRKASTTSVSSAPPKSVTTSHPHPRSTPKPQPSTTASKKIGQAQDEWCICRGPDDSTPMIKCEVCKDWLVFNYACGTRRNAHLISISITGFISLASIYKNEMPKKSVSLISVIGGICWG